MSDVAAFTTYRGCHSRASSRYTRHTDDAQLLFGRQAATAFRSILLDGADDGMSSTITRIAIVSWGSPTIPEIQATTSNTIIMNSDSWCISMAGSGRRLCSGMVFGPNSARRWRATSLLSPLAVAWSFTSTASISRICQVCDCTLWPGYQVDQCCGDYRDQQCLQPTAQPGDARNPAEKHPQQEEQQQRDADGGIQWRQQ